MLDVRWNIVFLSLTVHTLAQSPLSKHCGAPQVSINNARMQSQSSIRQKYAPTEKVLYECKEGYSRTGGFSYVTCQAGKWTALTLTCTKVGAAVKTCPQPVVSNAEQTGGGSSPSYTEGDSVSFLCSPGFLHTGDNSATCGADGTWTPGLPQCLLPPSGGDETTAPVLTCRPPKAARFTEFRGSKDVYGPGDSLVFSCTDDRTMNGSNAVTCGADGEWTPALPKCILLKCPELKVVNGKLSSKRMRVNSEVKVTCDAGHSLRGPGTVTCLETERWSGLPQCVADVKPVEVSCPRPAVENTVATGGSAEQASYRQGDTVTLICTAGYQRDGPLQVTCGTAGQWQPRLPTCLPSVHTTTRPPGECGSPQLLNQPNILLHDNYITQKSTVFAAGSRVRYVCELGYAPAGGSSYRSCINGQWTKLTLTCQRKSCGSAGEIPNGQFIYTGAEFGDSATAVCDEGYDMVGHKTRRCMSSGVWDGRVPVCEVVHCPDPPAVADAVMSGGFEPYTYRSVVSYRCTKGTLGGAKQLWCTKDATWSDPPPTCRDISCPVLPAVPHSFRTGALRPPYRPRDAVSFRCDRGFVLVGSVTVACGLDGRWTPEPPSCRWGRGRH